MVIILAVFILCNYLVSAINDGEGTFKDIYKFTGYSLLPMIICLPIAVGISYGLTLNEQVVITIFQAIGFWGSGIILVIGISETHNYTFSQTIKNIILTIIFMVLFLIICVVVIVMLDQIKTGEFIALKRKEKNLTQQELADKLNISNKTVSKWETGNGLPELSLMMPLCEVLGITVNELLSGESIGGEKYKEKAEENFINILEEKTKNKRRIILTAIGVGVILLCNFAILFTINYEEVSYLAETIIAISSLIMLLATCLIACYIDNRSGYFECGNCKKRFVPSYASYVMGMHTITRRHLKCPYCNKITWCKKRLTK